MTKTLIIILLCAFHFTVAQSNEEIVQKAAENLRQDFQNLGDRKGTKAIKNVLKSHKSSVKEK